LCCYNRISETGEFIKNRDLYHIVLETGKPKIEGHHLKRDIVIPSVMAECRRGEGEERY
jgi:hypothetical protein